MMYLVTSLTVFSDALCGCKIPAVAFFVFRLLVNLTQPAVLCFGNNIPDDRTGQHYYLDLVTQLQSYKEVRV